MDWKYSLIKIGGKIMDIKPIVILMIIIVISSISIVAAQDLKNSEINTALEENSSNSNSMIPAHHSLHHEQDYNNIVKNNFTIDGYTIKFIGEFILNNKILC